MKFMTPREAAAHLSEYGLSVEQARRRAKSGEYPHIYVGGRMLIDVDAVRPMLEARGEHAQTISTAELSAALGLKPTAIRRGVSEGWLPCRMAGHHYRFVLEDVEAALARRMESTVQSMEG